MKKITLIVLLFTVLISWVNPCIAQEKITIFKKDKPDIKLLWSRVADYSPTLRSVEAAEFSPNGKYVVSAAKFGYYLMLWRVADGFLYWEKVMDAEIEAVTFSPDGKYIAAGDEAYNVTIFDLEGNVIHVLEHDAAFDGITWRPDGKFVGGGSEKGEVVLWNTETWEKEIILKAGGTVNSLQFSKDSKKLIAAGNRVDKQNPDAPRHGFVKSWDVEKDWQEIFDFKAQDRSTKSVRFHPDEKSFAIAGFANQVKVFSYPDHNELAVFNFDKKLEAVEYHPEGNFLFAGGHGMEMYVYNTQDYIEVMKFPCRRVEYIDFTQDGRLMVTGHEDSGLLSLYLLWSKLTGEGHYDILQREILNNKDLKSKH
ncbi:MAG TPA: WD40 repeat domain-containing protein [Prolixibacteraceae bacterium]|nr:WD40 repeat domain-containing protein [Prolixibacteraceae bacterium]